MVRSRGHFVRLASFSPHQLFFLTPSFNIGFVASIWQILTPILLGAQLFIYDNNLIKKPYQFLEQLERNEINVVSMIPQSLYGYCQYIGDKHQKLTLSNMKQIILTGEKVRAVQAKSKKTHRESKKRLTKPPRRCILGYI